MALKHGGRSVFVTLNDIRKRTVLWGMIIEISRRLCALFLRKKKCLIVRSLARTSHGVSEREGKIRFVARSLRRDADERKNKRNGKNDKV